MMAAMLALEAGYSVINVADGFEGDPNPEHQRKSLMAGAPPNCPGDMNNRLRSSLL